MGEVCPDGWVVDGKSSACWAGRMKTMCLCCGKKISEDSSEIQNQWHKKCVKSFFGTNQFPEILISNEQLELLVSETVSKGFTIFERKTFDSRSRLFHL